MAEPVTTIGRVLVNQALPESLRRPDRVLNKKGTAELFQELAEKHPDEYVDILHKLNGISRVAGTEYGGVASVRLSDLKLPPKIKDYRRQLREKIQTIAQNKNITSAQRQEQIIGTMRRALPTIQEMLKKEVFDRDNAYGLGVKEGFRGSSAQLTQLLFGDMLLADHRGRPIPIPGLHGYGEGVTPAEYWAGSYASRAGYSSVQFATAKTGFLGKQLAAMAQQVVVTGDDCGANQVGIFVDGGDPEILGSVVAREVAGIPVGTVLEKKHLAKISGKKPLVRSLLTCQMPEGVCQRCSGKRENGRFPEVGTYLGIDAARISSEPMTQELALSAKHHGGMVGVTDTNLSGFDEINQFVQIPKIFRGASVLSPIEGKVRQIIKAPQGGHYLTVDTEQVYIPPDRKLSVAPGEQVEAGDMLTDGTPNPAEIAKYKGLGEGRKYFQDKFYEILKDNGVATHRRNVEALATSFFNRVRITRPEGIMGYRIDDIVPYGDLQRSYEPRDGAQTKAPKRVIGMYLERPVLHYSIGTRVTPKMASFLDKEGIPEVVAHKDEPGFEPQVTRLMGIPAQDPDWKVRLSGFGIKSALLDAARQGSTSMNSTPSYVPKLMDPSRL